MADRVLFETPGGLLGADDVFRHASRLQWLVPTCSNAGRKFPRAYFAELEQHVERLAGCLSRRPGLVAGTWTFSGRRYHDSSREYYVDVSDRQLAEELGLAIYQFVVRRFEQVAVSVDLSEITTTVFSPKESVMSLPTRFAWQPLAGAPRRAFLPLLLILVLVFARCDRAADVLPMCAASPLRSSTLSAKPSLRQVR